jgi:uncharacterized protein YjbJ (UPF0337 family)
MVGAPIYAGEWNRTARARFSPRIGELWRNPDITEQDRHMDKDRIKGSAQQAKGVVKEVAGKITGDAKLKSEGKADRAAGKLRNAVGGVKDTLRGK